MTYKELGKQSPILRTINETGVVSIVFDLNALRAWIDENTFIEEGDSHSYHNTFNLSNDVVNNVLRCIAYICDDSEKFNKIPFFVQEVIKTVCEFIATFKLDDCYDTWQHQMVDALQCFNVIENESNAKMLITIISDPENREARIAVKEYLHKVICCWKPYTIPMVYNFYSDKTKYALAAAVALHKEIEHGVYSPWSQYIECGNINQSTLPSLCNAGCVSLSNPTEMGKYAAMLAFYFITNKERLQNLYDIFFEAE